jgi:hypothetical protein
MTHAGAEPVAGPSGPGTVVLELGPGAGALILHVPVELNGAEIDISPANGRGPRTHSMVRPRHVPAGPRHAAVYPGLAPGDYTIWRDDGTSALTVTVTEGAATTARWPGHLPAR